MKLLFILTCFIYSLVQATKEGKLCNIKMMEK
jgi:hypothetical protein